MLAACSGGDEPEVRAIEPTSEPTEAAPEPTEPEDPYAIPDEIDVDYVQAVVDAVLPIYREPELEAFRTAPHTMPPDPLMAAVRAMYSPDLRVEQLTYYAGALGDADIAAARAEDIANLPEGGWTVTELVRADDTCIVAAIEFPEGGSPEGGHAVLLSGYDDADPNDLNPTPWVLDRSGPASLFPLEELEARCEAEQLADDPDEGDDDVGQAADA